MEGSEIQACRFQIDALSPHCQASLSLRLYATPDSDSHQGPDIIQSPLHMPFLCLLHLSGGALAPSLLPPSSFLQARHTLLPFSSVPSPPQQPLIHTLRNLQLVGGLSYTPPKDPGQAPSHGRSPAQFYPLEAQGPLLLASLPSSQSVPRWLPPISARLIPCGPHMTEAPSPGSQGEGRGSFTDHVASSGRHHSLLRHVSQNPSLSLPRWCQAGLGGGEQSEEGPASSCSEHLQQKGAISVSWSKGFISQMRKLWSREGEGRLEVLL